MKQHETTSEVTMSSKALRFGIVQTRGIIKGSVEVKLPTIWRVEKQGGEAEKRSRVRRN